MTDRRPTGIAGPLRQAALSSGDAHLLLGGQLRAETTVDQAQDGALAEAIDIVDTADRLGIDAADLGHLLDCACAPNPVGALWDWLDTETRPVMRRALAAAVLAITGGEQ